MSFRTLLAGLLAATLATSASAEITLPHLLTDGAILQRQQPVTLWGRADAGEQVRVTLDGKPVATTRADDQGHWQVTGKAYPAGGPHTITVQGDNRLQLEDVYFGDVWLASGQSNMEMKISNIKEKYADIVADAANPKIRQFEVPKVVDYDSPQWDVDGQWSSADPQSVLNFSAVGYFFARHIQRERDVPVGIITAAYGGSAAQAWMSPQALEAFPHYLKQAKRNRTTDYVAETKARDSERSNQWYAHINKHDKGLSSDPQWSSPAVDASDWPTLTLPGTWEAGGLPQINGTLWLRKTITLPASAAGQAAMLRLGRIVDADTAFINGQQVGRTTYKYPQRRYPVPEGLLKAGENTLVIRATTNAGGGGFVKDKPYVLEVGDTQVSLEGEWRYKIGVNHTPQKPREFWDFQQPVGMFNAMLSPLFRMPLKGVIWYQGESNVGAPDEYASLFPAMIRDWREHFGQPKLPFLFVQLPGFLEPTDDPNTDSNWAQMRDSQTKALGEPNTAMAVAIDLGDWNDIHPLAKKPVGDRLALLARHFVYGEKDLAAQSPAPYNLHVKDGKAIINVASTSGGLKSSGKPGGFAIAGKDGHYVWAKAELRGDRIVVWSDEVKTPTAVRYAWADYPQNANVYGGAGLPLMPFELKVESRQK